MRRRGGEVAHHGAPPWVIVCFAPHPLHHCGVQQTPPAPVPPLPLLLHPSHSCSTSTTPVPPLPPLFHPPTGGGGTQGGSSTVQRLPPGSSVFASNSRSGNTIPVCTEPLLILPPLPIHPPTPPFLAATGGGGAKSGSSTVWSSPRLQHIRFQQQQRQRRPPGRLQPPSQGHQHCVGGLRRHVARSQDDNVLSGESTLV